jgi:hypothetical protein
MYVVWLSVFKCGLWRWVGKCLTLSVGAAENTDASSRVTGNSSQA